MIIDEPGKALKISFVLTLFVALYAAFGCGENSSDGNGGDMDLTESEISDSAGSDRCADVGAEACPAATDCIIFTPVQTPFPECAIYCRADVINEGITCRVLEEFGVCSNGRCVIPGMVIDGDSDNLDCRPEYAEVPKCPEDVDCASFEHMWRPLPDCRWLCVAMPRNNGKECAVGIYNGVCENAQCVPYENGDGEVLQDGDIDDIENDDDTFDQDAESGDGEDGEDGEEIEFEDEIEDGSLIDDIDD